jgi:cell division transport system ATP-binding protein
MAVAAMLSGVKIADGLGGDRIAAGDFAVMSGAISALVGPTGAGKSTLFDTLRLAQPFYAGDVRVLGVDARGLASRKRAELKRRIGTIHQTPRLVDEFTAFANVALPFFAAGARNDGPADEISELLGYLGLAAFEDVPAGRLSASQRRAVAIARAAATRPELLVADEPTEGLDDDAAARVVRLLSELARAGCAVAVATRDAGFAAALTGAVWEIRDGRSFAVGERPC